MTSAIMIAAIMRIRMKFPKVRGVPSDASVAGLRGGFSLIFVGEPEDPSPLEVPDKYPLFLLAPF